MPGRRVTSRAKTDSHLSFLLAKARCASSGFLVSDGDILRGEFMYILGEESYLILKS